MCISSKVRVTSSALDLGDRELFAVTVQMRKVKGNILENRDIVVTFFMDRNWSIDLLRITE